MVNTTCKKMFALLGFFNNFSLHKRVRLASATISCEINKVILSYLNSSQLTVVILCIMYDNIGVVLCNSTFQLTQINKYCLDTIYCNN